MFTNLFNLDRVYFTPSIPSVVVKHVQLLTSLDHPRGWNTNRSHEKNTSPISLKSNGMQA